MNNHTSKYPFLVNAAINAALFISLNKLEYVEKEDLLYSNINAELIHPLHL